MDATRQWLRSTLTSKYQNVDRTFRDVDAVLVAYAGILPKMDNFTHDNGQKQLLFCLYGTIPISFRGSTYNIPIAVWLPYSYPRHPPFCFVTPTATMLVRQGKHVDLSGKVYHPLLSTWHTRPDDVSLMQLLGVMQTIFTNEPPVYSKPAVPPGGSQPRNSPHPQGGSATPPPPPYPPSHHSPSQRTTPMPIATPSYLVSGANSGRYGVDGAATTTATSFSASPPTSRTLGGAPPAIPAKPPGASGTSSLSSSPKLGVASGIGGFPSQIAPAIPPKPGSPASAAASSGSGFAGGYISGVGMSTSPPPSSSPATSWSAPGVMAAAYNRPGVTPPPPPSQGSPPPVPARPPQSQLHDVLAPAPPPLPPAPHLHQPLGRPAQPAPQPPYAIAHQQYGGPSPPTPSPLVATAASTAATSPTATTGGSSKDAADAGRAAALRAALRERLRVADAAHRGRTHAEIERLVAVNRHLAAGAGQVQEVLRRFAEEERKVKTNIDALEAQNAELIGLIANVRSEPEVKVDEILVGAGGVVYNQLLDTVAEEHAIEDTIYYLGKALNSERIELAVFLKLARTLGRELFFKRALVAKIQTTIAFQ